MRKTIAALLLSTAMASLFAASEAVVDKGRLQDGFTIGDGWGSSSAALTATGVGNVIASRHLFAPGDFTVKATLRLGALNGSAAAFGFGNHLFGFDGREPEKQFFLEAKTGEVAPLGQAAEHIRPGEWFEFAAVAAADKITFSVNGKTIHTAAFIETENLGFQLRPQRNRMEIREFSVAGTPRGDNPLSYEQVNGMRLLTPIYRSPLNIAIDQELSLDSPRGVSPGTFRAELRPVEGKDGNAASADIEIRQGNLLLLPAALMNEAWRKSSNAQNARPAKLTLYRKGQKVYETRLLLYNPAQPIDFPKGEVARRGGTPTFIINGEPVGTITSRQSSEQARSPRHRSETIRDFATAGVRGNLVWVAPGLFSYGGKVDEQAFLKHVYGVLTRVVCDNPNSFVDFHWELYAPPEWSSLHPEEMIKLDNGAQSLMNAPEKKLQPSYASELWRAETTRLLQSLLAELRKSPFADRIAIFRVCYANCAEWNHWGYHEQAFVDFSPPMQRAFGKWLRTKYGSVEALRRAWGNPSVTFDSGDLVPKRAARLAEDTLLRHGTEAQAVVDYYQFFQLHTVETIEHFAKTVKQASASRLLVGAYYGYYIGHYTAAPYHFQDSGAYALRRYLESPFLDFLGGPYPYDNRRDNCEVQGVTGSVALHGKVWESEGDQRTQHSGAANKCYGTTDNLPESIAIAKRDFMLNLQRHASYYFFDFLADWYRDPEFMRTVALLKGIDRFTLSAGRESRAQVALVLSEATIPYLSNHPQKALAELRNALTGTINRIGARVDYYLDSDLGKIDFTPYKTVIFANSYYVDAQTMRLTREKVCGNGRSVLFLYAPGVLGPEGKLDVERSRGFTGIGLKIKPSGEFTRVNSIGMEPYMSTPPIRFQTFIDDDTATPTALYPDGKIAGAMKVFPTHTATVLCHPAPNAAWLRAWLKKQGVHIYQDGDRDYDCYYFAGSLIGVYSRLGGPRDFVLPREVEVIADMFTGEILARNTDRFSFQLPMKTPETRIFYAGGLTEYEQYRQRCLQPPHCGKAQDGN